MNPLCAVGKRMSPEIRKTKSYKIEINLTAPREFFFTIVDVLHLKDCGASFAEAFSVLVALKWFLEFGAVGADKY